jgi:hypothetical protein
MSSLKRPAKLQALIDSMPRLYPMPPEQAESEWQAFVDSLSRDPWHGPNLRAEGIEYAQRLRASRPHASFLPRSAASSIQKARPE